MIPKADSKYLGDWCKIASISSAAAPNMSCSDLHFIYKYPVKKDRMPIVLTVAS